MLVSVSCNKEGAFTPVTCSRLILFCDLSLKTFLTCPPRDGDVLQSIALEETHILNAAKTHVAKWLS